MVVERNYYSCASKLYLSDYVGGLTHEDLEPCQGVEADSMAGTQRGLILSLVKVSSFSSYS